MSEQQRRLSHQFVEKLVQEGLLQVWGTREARTRSPWLLGWTVKRSPCRGGGGGLRAQGGAAATCVKPILLRKSSAGVETVHMSLPPLWRRRPGRRR